MSSSLTASGETRDMRYEFSNNFPLVLERMKCSLLIPTYQTGNLVVLGARGGKLAVSFHTFDRPMGMSVWSDWLAVSTRTQIWFLRNVPELVSRIQPQGGHDACYLTRSSHFIGDIQGHELGCISLPPGDTWYREL